MATQTGLGSATSDKNYFVDSDGEDDMSKLNGGDEEFGLLRKKKLTRRKSASGECESKPYIMIYDRTISQATVIKLMQT